MDHLSGSKQFDLLFSDVILPGGMSGVDVAEQALRLQPHIKVLHTSGYTDKADFQFSRLAAGTTLITKPFHREELLEKIRLTLA